MKQLVRRSKVLIVDDLASNRIALSRILEELDIEIHEADSGRKALALVLRNQFSVILMDVKMPVMDGYETASLIHNNRRFENIPIVMVTAGENNESDYMKAYQAGAVDYITKPVKPLVLTNKVKQFVELDNQRRIAVAAEEDNAQSRARLEVLLEAAGEGIIGIDLKGIITFVNPKACELLRLHKCALLDASIFRFIQLNSDDSHLAEELSKQSFSIESSIGPHSYMVQQNQRIIHYFAEQSKNEDNRDHWVDNDGTVFYPQICCESTYSKTGNCEGAVILFQNISDKREMEKKLKTLASFDPLTQLANRHYFQDALNRAIARSQRTMSLLGLLFLDLDHFKYVNDSLGHDVGDLLLQCISQRIIKGIRRGDVVARMGGDEFAIILHDLTSVEDAGVIASNILSLVSKPILIKDNNLETSVSIGISLLDENNTNVDDLVKSADTAMYYAKKLGRNKYKYFKKEMQEKAEKSSKMQIALHKAVSNHELELYYQPKVSFSKYQVVGGEALLRWFPPGQPMISPDVFIPIAESSGQIIDIGYWVLKQACQQIKKWNELNQMKNMVLSVNVSTIQLMAGNFENILKKVIVENNIPPEMLEIELTETGVMFDPVNAKNVLGTIHELGVAISIDDFGTGHSSIDQLRRLPIDSIKIDRSFVKDIGVDKQDEEIILAMLALARTMDIQVIAEGVETAQQVDFLVDAGCDLFQGYFFSKPVAIDDYERFVFNGLPQTFPLLAH